MFVARVAARLLGPAAGAALMAGRPRTALAAQHGPASLRATSAVAVAAGIFGTAGALLLAQAKADEAAKPPAGPTVEAPFEYDALTHALYARAQSEAALREYIARVRLDGGRCVLAKFSKHTHVSICRRPKNASANCRPSTPKTCAPRASRKRGRYLPRSTTT